VHPILRLLLFCKRLSIIIESHSFIKFVYCCLLFHSRCQMLKFRRLDPGSSNMKVEECYFFEYICSINCIANNLCPSVYKFLLNAFLPIFLNIHALQLYIRNLWMIYLLFTSIFPLSINIILVFMHQFIFKFLL